MNADQIVGEKVHVLLRRNGIAQGDLAPYLGIDQSSMSKKLYGKRTWTLDELITVAHVLRVPLAELLPGDDYAPTLEGRGRSAVVRPKGLEPLTFWSVAESVDSGAFWSEARSLALASLWRQLDLDIESSIPEGVE